MRSESMSNALRRLQVKFGERFGLEVWANMLQRFWLNPWDDVSNEMRRAVYGA